MDEIIKDFKFATDIPRIIKVIGVGGGGCNAVSHMYREGIDGVSFMVCNTDMKSVNDSPVRDKLLLGEGLGAGNDPEEGRTLSFNCLMPVPFWFFLPRGWGVVPAPPPLPLWQKSRGKWASCRLAS